jgi:hypothetical protein
MNTFQRYEQEKRAWVYTHPDASPEQLERAFKAIAKRLGI